MRISESSFVLYSLFAFIIISTMYLDGTKRCFMCSCDVKKLLTHTLVVLETVIGWR